MYLHKKGCEYYKLVFQNLSLASEKIVRDFESGNGSGNQRKMSISDLIGYNGNEVDPSNKINELLGHLANIKEQIEDEENVFNKLIEKIDAAMREAGIKITHPDSQKLMVIMTEMKVNNENFKDLTKTLESLQNLIKDHGKDVTTTLFANYTNINTFLDRIEQNSLRLGEKLRKLIEFLQKEKELINKEAELIPTFTENLMSWI